MAPSSLMILARYQYDPLDRLMGVGLLERASTRRFYQENYLVTELDGQGQRSIIRHAAQPLAQQQNMAGVSETTLLATDRAHSLLQTLTDNNPQQLAYTAYGHHPAESALSHLLGFNGECPDSITGHYLLGQGKRAYNPVLMRFNSPDDLSPFGEGGINSYAYCGNDPVNFHDSTGNVRLRVVSEMSHRGTVIVKNPQYSVQKTAGSIARPDLATSNPTLNKMLDIPITNSSPQLQASTSTLMPQGEVFTYELADTLTIKHSRIAKTNRHNTYNAKLRRMALEHDHHRKHTPNFQTLASKKLQDQWGKQNDKVSILSKTSWPSPELNFSKIQLSRTEMLIKKYSVESYNKNQQIRKK